MQKFRTKGGTIRGIGDTTWCKKIKKTIHICDLVDCDIPHDVYRFLNFPNAFFTDLEHHFAYCKFLKEEYNQNMGQKEGGRFSRLGRTVRESRPARWLTETNTVLGEDPYVVAHEDSFVVFQSDRTDRKIVARKFKAPEDMVKAKEVTVFKPDSKNDHRFLLWAPEAHTFPDFSDKWYLYYTASREDNRSHRTFVAESEGADPMGPYHEKGRIFDPQSDLWGIDMTVLHHEGRDYTIWSGTANDEGRFPQNLYIARLQNPWTIQGERRLLATPEYPWQFSKEPILEGPQVLKTGGQLSVFFAANGSWAPEYAVGILQHKGGDIMDLNNWDHHPVPILDENGAGHGSAFKTEDGRNIMVVGQKAALQNGWMDREIEFKEFEIDPVTRLPVFKSPDVEKSEDVLDTQKRILEPISSFGPTRELVSFPVNGHAGNGNGNGKHSDIPHQVA